MYQLIFAALVLCLLFKVLNVNNSPEKSLFYCSNAKFLEEIIRQAPSLTEAYHPTRLWGYSGHIQTIIQGVLSRIICPLVNGKRYFFMQPDGATVTYDLYQPMEPHAQNGDYTLALCPGICNTSESVYIRRVVYQAQFQGYRVAVLNHLGALKNVPITSPRIFCYGNTRDYDGMIHDLCRRYPGTKFLCVGFSMGGNLITKYLGEKNSNRPDERILAGISCCQGYDITEAVKYLLQWENGRRLYLFTMTENMKNIIRSWQKQLFPEILKKEKRIVMRDIWSAATLVELDEAYTRKIENCDSVYEFYGKSSCAAYFEGINVPMVFINAQDDPIVPPPLLNIVKNAVRKKDNFLYIEQKYGGHLGFYEGGFIYPNSVTWLDKNVVNLSDALVHYMSSEKKSHEKLKDLELEEENLVLEMLEKKEFVHEIHDKPRSTKRSKVSYVIKRKGTVKIKKSLKVAI